MKSLGILGGMSWQSTREYYRLLNEGVAECLGGVHSADVFIKSFDFDSIARLQHDNRWDALTELLVDAACKLERAGCDAILIATNTMHTVAPEVQAALQIPLLNILDAVGEVLQQQGACKPLLLGTRFTMEQSFYRQHLQDGFNQSVLIPNEPNRLQIHDIIFNQLVKGQIYPQSKAIFLEVVQQAIKEQGADSVILGCTEIPLLIAQSDINVPALDTTAIHVNQALRFMLGG